MTLSMRIALNDLALDGLYVVYPGERRYRIGERVEVVPLAALWHESGSPPEIRDCLQCNKALADAR